MVDQVVEAIDLGFDFLLVESGVEFDFAVPPFRLIPENQVAFRYCAPTANEQSEKPLMLIPSIPILSSETGMVTC